MSLISKKLRVFMSVVNHGSIRKAAYELSLTSSPISRMVTELESYLGTTLFHRNGKGLTLTDSGFTLYNQLLPIYREISSIENSLRPRIKSDENIIRVFYDWGNEPIIMQMQSNLQESKTAHTFEFTFYDNKTDLLNQFNEHKDVVVSSRNIEKSESSSYSLLLTDMLAVVYCPSIPREKTHKRILLSQRQKMNPVVMRMVYEICSSQECEGFSVVGSSAMMHEMVLDGQGRSIVPQKFSLLPGWRNAIFDTSFTTNLVAFRTTLFHSVTGTALKSVRQLLRGIC